MNIGFFFMHPPGESMGSIYRVRNLCLGLTKLSHKCYVFTPFKFTENWGDLVEFISTPVMPSEKKISVSKYLYKIVRKILDIRILSSFTILNPLLFNFTIQRISYGLLNTLKEKKIALDVLIGETEIGGLILNNIKNQLNFPLIVDYQNFWPEELVEHKIIKRNGRTYRYLISMEKRIINKIDF
ncbi:MAG: hypothetical protein ACFFDN_50935, partial [Candidatus Hodarchaeota archaeon]